MLGFAMATGVAQAIEVEREQSLLHDKDYDVVRNSLRYLSEYREHQPDLNQLSAYLGMEPTACHKLFKRWCGLTPKEFLQAATLDHARNMLQQSASVLDAAHASGLSGSGRLHDLCVSYDAMTPGDIKQRGMNVVFTYGFHDTPFGPAVLLVTDRGLAGLSFENHDTNETVNHALECYRLRWPAAQFVRNEKTTEPFVQQVFGNLGLNGNQHQIRVVLIGTDFEIRVWNALLNVPVGGAASYQMIAQAIGQPTATRAVGTAIGHNPISFVVPCHRILRKDGALGGYRWGVTRKRAIIGWELGHQRQSAPQS